MLQYLVSWAMSRVVCLSVTTPQQSAAHTSRATSRVSVFHNASDNTEVDIFVQFLTIIPTVLGSCRDVT